MTTSAWFQDLPVLGALSPEQAAAKLRQVDENEAATALERVETGATREAVSFGGPRGIQWPFGNKPWQHTAHAFGYLAPAPPSSDPLPIQHAGNIVPQADLKNSRIKITLNSLRVADYPGGGVHRVLFDFYARNQVPDSPAEYPHFNLTCRVQEGERAAILNLPIFVGLGVGTEGVDFRCLTVNVHNEDDESLLSFLESDTFKAGLQLATTVQPAIGPLSGMVMGLTRTIAGHRKNVPVQEFHLGLDFTTILGGARLAEGSYLAVQIPETFQTVWDWSEWVYNPNNGQVVNKESPTQLIPYNYLVFGISRYEGK